MNHKAAVGTKMHPIPGAYNPRAILDTRSGILGNGNVGDGGNKHNDREKRLHPGKSASIKYRMVHGPYVLTFGKRNTG
jgi:hypothetical protein